MFQDIAAQQLTMNTNGMYMLLVWAVLNMAIGAFVWLKYHAAKKHTVQYWFGLMCFLWNIVNLVLAVGGLVWLSMIKPDEMELRDIIYTMFQMEKLLLFNAGLDIAYIAIGSFLHERGQHTKNLMYQGFGKALWLQGGFLFFFDLVLFLLNTFTNHQYAFYILF